MPKKLNFLGGQQNYNEHTGEYEPALVGKGGNVVTDADGDGITHENTKKKVFDEATKKVTKDKYAKLVKQGYSQGEAIEKLASEYDSDDDRLYESKENFDKKHREHVDKVKGLLDINEVEKQEKDFNEPIKDTRVEKAYDKDGKEIAPKKYTIGSDKRLKGDEREKMNQLVERLKQEGLNAELVDGWEDYGAGMEWTAPTIHEKGGLFEKEGVWALNPKQWLDYMNGDKSADEIIADMKQDKYQKGWFKKELSFEDAVKNADDDVLDKQFGKGTPERKLVGAMKEDKAKSEVVGYGNSRKFLEKYGLQDKFEFDGMDLVDKKDMSTTSINFGRDGKPEEELLQEIKKSYPNLKIKEQLTQPSGTPQTSFKLDKKKYPDVEETPYGFIYNAHGRSITDMKAQRKAFGDPVEEGKNYGFNLEVGGDESYYNTFDEAYNRAKELSQPKTKSEKRNPRGETILEEAMQDMAFKENSNGETMEEFIKHNDLVKKYPKEEDFMEAIDEFALDVGERYTPMHNLWTSSDELRALAKEYRRRVLQGKKLAPYED